MSYEQKDNSGAMFKNDKKTDATPAWADYNGDAMIDGKKYWVNCWVKESKAGKKFFSLSFKPKEIPASASDELGF